MTTNKTLCTVTAMLLVSLSSCVGVPIVPNTTFEHVFWGTDGEVYEMPLAGTSSSGQATEALLILTKATGAPTEIIYLREDSSPIIATADGKTFTLPRGMDLSEATTSDLLISEPLVSRQGFDCKKITGSITNSAAIACVQAMCDHANCSSFGNCGGSSEFNLRTWRNAVCGFSGPRMGFIRPR